MRFCFVCLQINCMKQFSSSYLNIVLRKQEASAKQESTREACTLAIWQLRDNQPHQKTKEFHTQNEETLLRDTASSEAVSPAISNNHVMLSYNWDSQETVLTISNNLKKDGYNVWIDVEKMGKLYHVYRDKSVFRRVISPFVFYYYCYYFLYSERSFI